MPRRATAVEVMTLLRERPHDVLDMLNEPEAQLSLPVDGAGVRILAAVPHLPVSSGTVLRLSIAGQEVEVPVEFSEQAEEFVLL